MRRHVTVGGLLACLAAGPVDAQIASEGTVRGVVRDAGGGVLPGVTVTAVSRTVPGTHISLTEADGQYRLLNLPPAYSTPQPSSRASRSTSGRALRSAPDDQGGHEPAFRDSGIPSPEPRMERQQRSPRRASDCGEL